MSDGKAQVERILAICGEISAVLESLPDSAEGLSGDERKRLRDIVNILEGIKNKVFFRTKTSLSFTMPALSAAERIKEALEDLVGHGDGDFTAVGEELDSLESNVDILKVKAASQDIIIT